MTNKPSIFIGSSVESLELAYAAQKRLCYSAEVTVWSQGVFELSKTALESLLQKLEEFDFGLFIFAPDDITNIRGSKSRTVRDNVVFELGLFIGYLGRERCFILAPNNYKKLHLPTDLLGINPATYETDRIGRNTEAALGPACYEIESAIKKAGAFLRKPSISDAQGELHSSGSTSTVKSNIHIRRGNSANPFNPVGTLKILDPSYIKRSCDQELKTALLKKTHIAITGEYRIGKSSLMRQIPLFLNDSWKICLLDFQGIRTDSVDKFMDGFFKNVGHTFGNIDTLDDFAKDLKKQPVVLCLDEFGRLTREIAESLIPNLHWLSNEVGKNFHIVICLPTHIKDFLSSLKIENPKYSREWHNIDVNPFNRKQTIELLNLLPKRLKEMAVSQYDLIMKLSLGRPQSLQSLCYQLFEASQNNYTETACLNIIRDQNSYK